MADLHLTNVPADTFTQLDWLRTYLAFDDRDVVVNALRVYIALVRAKRDGKTPQIRRPDGSVEDFII